MINDLIHQITPEDSFLVYDRIINDFNQPIHFHPEYELNFIENGKGLKRTVGDHTEVIENYELVLMGPNLLHGWELHHCRNKRIHEIKIHINNDLLDDKLLKRKIFKSIRGMYAKSNYGLLFSKKITKIMMPKLVNLTKVQGIDYYLEFISVLYELSNSKNQRLLSTHFSANNNFVNSSRIKKVSDYVQKNYQKKISLTEISQLINMSPVSFNRFIKQTTGKTFVVSLNNIRINEASRLLLETNLSIGDVGFKCGFNNISNFNRLFKRAYHCTPRNYRNKLMTT